MKGYYYSLTREQTTYLRSVVAGKTVADLGCGDGSLAVSLMNLGANTVHAVDKSPARVKHGGVVFHQSYFDRWEMPEDVRVAVVSWPQNNGLPGIAGLLSRVSEVIYLGKNTDGTACGSGTLFAGLIRRNVLKCIPDRRNVMIHYDNRPRENPVLYHEEFAALTQNQSYSYNPSPDLRDTLSWGEF